MTLMIMTVMTMLMKIVRKVESPSQTGKEVVMGVCDKQTINKCVFHPV